MDKISKLKSIVSIGNTKHSQDCVDASLLITEAAVSHFKLPSHSGSGFDHDPRYDREMIDSIESEYFVSENGARAGNGAEICRKELLVYVENMDSEEMRQRCDILKRQHKSVSKRVSELVLQNHPAYVRELERVQELETALQAGCSVARDARMSLGASHRASVRPSLQLLSNCRKRHKLATLLRSLHTIKTLQVSDVRLRELLSEEDFPGAIQLCLECQQVAATYRHFRCISELSVKLQDTLVMTEEALDVALAKTTERFSSEHYSKLQAAYGLLGKQQSALDQLHMHFTSAIHNKAFQIVLGFVQLCSPGADGVAPVGDHPGTLPTEQSIQKRQYADLCKLLARDAFTPCLIALCEALWGIILAYHQAMTWHSEQDSPDQPQATAVAAAANGTASSSGTAEAQFQRSFVRQKLHQGPLRMWQDVQSKVRQLVAAMDFSEFRFEAVIRVLDVVNRLVRVGEELCGATSEALQDSLRQQMLHYFRIYHQSRLEDLRMFLENEGWQPVPVKSSFSALDLAEYRHLRQKLQQQDQDADAVDVPGSGKYLEQYAAGGNPFVFPPDDESAVEDILMHGDEMNSVGGSDTDEDDDSVLHATAIDEESGRPVTRQNSRRSARRMRSSSGAASVTAPLVANSTLEVLRLCGRYVHMIYLLRPIAFEVAYRLAQLIEYYMYAVYWFFGSDRAELVQNTLTPRLRQSLKRISESLIVQPGQEMLANQIPGSGGQSPGHQPITSERVLRPTLNPGIFLGSRDTLQGLPERLLGVDSLTYLSDQVSKLLMPTLEVLLAAERRPFLASLSAHTLTPIADLRLPICCTVALYSPNWEKVLQEMSRVDWAVQEILTQHNSYVDLLLQELGLFAERLQLIDRQRLAIPEQRAETIWHYVILCAARTLVDGFGMAKRCTTEGRALMQLDFRQYLLQLEKLTSLRPLPYRNYIDAYIKAYYLPANQLSSWLRSSDTEGAGGGANYYIRQLTSLVNCMTHLQRKERAEMLALLESDGLQQQQQVTNAISE